ncbi:hypothetical protein Gotur_012640 [Gossypium turneri]
MSDVNESLEVIKGCIVKLDYIGDELKKQALKTKREEFKGKLVLCKVVVGNRMLAMISKHKIDVPKSKEFKGTKFMRDVDNFSWGIELYFHVVGTKDDATKVKLLLCS